MPSGSTELPHTNQGFLLRAQKYLVLFGAGYLALILLLAIPYFQLHAIFLHAAKWPLFAKFDQPEAYGLAPGKTLNLQIPSTDNVTLGAWLMLSENYYQTLPTVPTALSLPDHIPRALKSRPTILFLHGNAATRAVPFRVQLCSMFTSRLQTNVLSLDYRGYGDSTGLPSEKGLVQDVWAAWNWLLDHGARPEDIAIVGHSLGTGAGSAFAYELVQSGQSARGLALLAPFSSLATLLDTYYILGLIPLMRPLEVFPGARQIVKYFLATHYDTLAILPNITFPIVLAHADDDWEIPPTHSDTLFNALLAPYLPPVPSAPRPGMDEAAQRGYERVLKLYEEHAAERARIVERVTIQGFGVLEKFTSHVLVKAHYGEHNNIGLQEGVQDTIRVAFKF